MMQVVIHSSALEGLTGKIKMLLPGGETYNQIMQTVSANMLAKVKQRIHQQGQAADGSDIGAYSTKPVYISVANNNAIGLPTGKTGKAQFANGKKKGQPHTSKYFAGGYSDFKTAIGLNPTGKANLFLTGALSEQLTITGNTTGTGYGLGFLTEQYHTRALALEAKYGKPIWALTEQERSEVEALVAERMADVFK